MLCHLEPFAGLCQRVILLAGKRGYLTGLHVVLCLCRCGQVAGAVKDRDIGIGILDLLQGLGQIRQGSGAGNAADDLVLFIIQGVGHVDVGLACHLGDRYVRKVFVALDGLLGIFTLGNIPQLIVIASGHLYAVRTKDEHQTALILEGAIFRNKLRMGPIQILLGRIGQRIG